MQVDGEWKEFCFSYNRGLGCNDPCSAGRLHRCEICTSPKHGSKDHDAVRKGKGAKSGGGGKAKGQKAGKGAKDAGSGTKGQ